MPWEVKFSGNEMLLLTNLIGILVSTANSCTPEIPKLWLLPLLQLCRRMAMSINVTHAYGDAFNYYCCRVHLFIKPLLFVKRNIT